MIADFPRAAKGLWIVPSSLSRNQVERELVRSARGHSIATVWTWAELWREIRARRGEGPLLLSAAASRVLHNEAIATARRTGRIQPLGETVDSPGFRRRLRGRIAAWTRAGRDPTATSPDEEPIAAAEWAIFATYRRLLNRLGAEDEDGLARWASGILVADPPKDFQELHRLRVVEPPNTHDSLIALGALIARARDVAISLVYDPDPARAELFGSEGPTRDRLLGLHLVEETVVPSPRPDALDHLGRNLFREPLAAALPQVSAIEFCGAPRGSGEALMIARHARELLDSGITADEIAIVSSQHDEDNLLVVEILRDWKIAAHLERSPQLANDPRLSALKSAASLPIDGWDAETLIRLLRHGAIGLSWSEAAATQSLATAATAVAESRAFRGANAIRDALTHASRAETKPEKPEAHSRARRASRAAAALPLIDRFIRTIETIARPGPWRGCVDRLFVLSHELGLTESPSLDMLRLALDEHGEILSRMKREDAIWSWDAFVAEVTTAIRDLGSAGLQPADRSIPIIEPHNLAGVTCRHLILFKLGERAFASFPSAEHAGQEEDESRQTASKRDMLTFFRTVSAPSDGLTLVFPTADESGQLLLASGFLDDVRDLFTPDALVAATRSTTRLDAVLPADLAIAPQEACVRAVALACLHGDRSSLERFARSPEHEGALNGTARALRLAHWRSRRGRFHRFDGRLSDPKIIQQLTAEFSNKRRPFSASQLESLALCPFQFFQRYVLGLEPPEERRELDEDRVTRGTMLHQGLEILHSTLRDHPPEMGHTLNDRVEETIVGVFNQVLAEGSHFRSEIEGGLFAIEAERLRRTARRYARQFREYAEKDGRDASAQHLEYAFGETRGSTASLTLGEGDKAIRVDGFIDRIDLIDRDGRSLFRVIDYKSGHIPTSSDITSGLALQLPLYAMAAQRTLFASGLSMPLDAGYWDLKKDGYKPKREMSSLGGDQATIENGWHAFSCALERYVIALVDRLMHGDFPVRPRKPDCERFCDYRLVCRIKQARRRPKTWTESPTLEDPS